MGQGRGEHAVADGAESGAGGTLGHDEGGEGRQTKRGQAALGEGKGHRTKRKTSCKNSPPNARRSKSLTVWRRSTSRWRNSPRKTRWSSSWQKIYRRRNEHRLY